MNKILPFEAARARMIKYAQKCLGLEIKIIDKNTTFGNPVVAQGTYHPSLVENSCEVSLVLQRGYLNLRGYILGPKVSFGNIMDDTAMWIETGKGLCSELLRRYV